MQVKTVLRRARCEMKSGVGRMARTTATSQGGSQLRHLTLAPGPRASLPSPFLLHFPSICQVPAGYLRLLPSMFFHKFCLGRTDFSFSTSEAPLHGTRNTPPTSPGARPLHQYTVGWDPHTPHLPVPSTQLPGSHGEHFCEHVKEEQEL